MRLQGLHNTRERYGSVAVAFHWIVAAAVVALLALGLYMARLPDAGFDKTKIVLVLYHKEYGILVLLMVAARLAWRLLQPLPWLAPAPAWQKVSARFVHLCLYGLLVALPVTGWLMSSAAALPVPFFKLGFLPDLIPRDDRLFHAFLAMHKWLAYGLIALLAVHAGAALWHHFVTRDDTLRKMSPGAPR
jgi:cytochrome b561